MKTRVRVLWGSIHVTKVEKFFCAEFSIVFGTNQKILNQIYDTTPNKPTKIILKNVMFLWNFEKPGKIKKAPENYKLKYYLILNWIEPVPTFVIIFPPV